MASTVHPLKAPKKHKKRTKFRYVKMIVVDNLKAETIEHQVESHIEPESLFKTDNYKSYNKIKKMVCSHQAETVKPKDVEKVLVHSRISNVKRNLLGIHHMISKKDYHDYLDEFCYKVNRRHLGDKLFDKLLFAYVSYNYKDYIHVNR